MEVTLFASGDSITKGKLASVCERPYAENTDVDPKVAECLHISHLMEQADQFDIIHNHFDFLPLSYSRLIKTPMVTTIHGFSSPEIIPVFKKYNSSSYYVSFSNSDRSPQLSYTAIVYNGIDTREFSFNAESGETLLFFGRIHSEKGVSEAIEIAKKPNRKLLISGQIQDQEYFAKKVNPYIDSQEIMYVGNSGPVERNKLMGGAYALLHPTGF